jgi:hypothetical protein
MGLITGQPEPGVAVGRASAARKCRGGPVAGAAPQSIYRLLRAAATPHATIPGASAPPPARRALAAHIGAVVDVRIVVGIVGETASTTAEAEAPAPAASTMASTTMATTTVAPAPTTVASTTVASTTVPTSATTSAGSLCCSAGENIGGYKSAGKIHHDHERRRQEPRQQPSPWSTLHLLSSLLLRPPQRTSPAMANEVVIRIFERKRRQPSVDGARCRAVPASALCRERPDMY